jgi:polyisoprenoid-binding protein YceI
MTGLGFRRTEHHNRNEDAMTSTDRGNRVSEALAVAAVWTLDLSGPTIEFRTRSFWGLLKIRGSFKAVKGTARVTETGVEGTLVIDASSIDTGNEKLDQHLRSPDWFDSELHPTFVFLLQGATPMRDATVRLNGSFIVRGHSRPLEIVATVVEAQSDTIELKSEFQIDRRRLGYFAYQDGSQNAHQD